MTSKPLKTNTKRETAKLEEELNDLVNSNDPDLAAKIRNLKEELNLKEQEHLERELQFKENFTLLEDEKPTKNFLNLESTKGGYNESSVNSSPTLILNKRRALTTSNTMYSMTNL